MSAKTRAKIPARKECVAIVLERDKGCVWNRQMAPLVIPGIRTPLFADLEKCEGGLDVHEPVHRSQGGDPTDPDQCVTLCRKHHRWAHDNPRLAKAAGL